MSAAPKPKRAKYARNDRLLKRGVLASVLWQAGAGLVIGIVAIPVSYGYGFRGTLASANFSGAERAFADKPSIQYPDLLADNSLDRELIQPLGPTPLFNLQTPEGLATQGVYELGDDDPAAMLAEVAAVWRESGLRVGTLNGRLVATPGDGSDAVYTAVAMADRDALVVSGMAGEGDGMAEAFERFHLPPLPADASLDFMGSTAAGFSIDYTIGGHPDDAYEEMAVELAARGWRRVEAAASSFTLPGQGVFQRGPSRLTLATHFAGDFDTRVSLVMF